MHLLVTGRPGRIGCPRICPVGAWRAVGVPAWLGDIAGAQQWREELPGAALSVQGRGPSPLQAPVACRLEEALCAGYLAPEVARVERCAPDGFVDVTQVADAEGLAAERRGYGRVLELGAGRFQGLSQYR